MPLYSLGFHLYAGLARTQREMTNRCRKGSGFLATVRSLSENKSQKMTALSPCALNAFLCLAFCSREKQPIMFLLRPICERLDILPLWSAISSTFYCGVESQTLCSTNCRSRLRMWMHFTESEEAVSNPSLGKQNHLSFTVFIHCLHAQLCTPFVKSLSNIIATLWRSCCILLGNHIQHPADTFRS